MEASKKVTTDHEAFREVETEVRDRVHRLLSVNGTRSVDSFHRELGKLVWDECGMSRNASGLKEALRRIPEIREDFWRDVRVLGNGESLNQSLEKAGRVADFLEFAEIMCSDALLREESCGGHFREEYQSPEGEALRNDQEFAYAAVWGYQGEGQKPSLTKEPFVFENVELTTRSYK